MRGSSNNQRQEFDLWQISSWLVTEISLWWSIFFFLIPLYGKDYCCLTRCYFNSQSSFYENSQCTLILCPLFQSFGLSCTIILLSCKGLTPCRNSMEMVFLLWQRVTFVGHLINHTCFPSKCVLWQEHLFGKIPPIPMGWFSICSHFRVKLNQWTLTVFS